MLRTVGVVDFLQCLGLWCCCVVLQRAWQESESKSGKTLKVHFTAFRHVKPSREVNAVSTDIPLDGLLSFCNDACPSQLPPKRPCSVYGTLAALRGVQRSTTACGNSCERHQSSGEHPAGPTPMHTRDSLRFNTGAPPPSTRCYGENLPRACETTTASSLRTRTLGNANTLVRIQTAS
jgi:hypothetical protein